MLKNSLYIKVYDRRGITLPEPIGTDIVYIFTKLMEGLKIFTKIREFIDKSIDGTEVCMEDFIVYGDKKVDIVLTKEFYAISISILSSYTYDCFILEIISDKWIKNHTKYYSNIESIFSTLKEDVNEFINL
ncbi:hypothetical protein [Clostridium sp. C8-1-8]|uniref:hypothetical protein n=1 Tax=Clostridium sp. C8-1-8 TaxID=2698831 RepID=UPI0013720106|nr:hypothetical protein [Clostridium sp. C8-1-8]